jgi:hypothetical protein
MKTPVWLNGAPAGRIEVGLPTCRGESGGLERAGTRIYAVANSEKLSRLDELAELIR